MLPENGRVWGGEQVVGRVRFGLEYGCGGIQDRGLRWLREHVDGGDWQLGLREV